MRYSSRHKQETRESILDEAGRAFRAEGVAGTGIAGLMARAGLTHGGFYAHFENKDALVAESCARALGQSTETLGERAAGAPAGDVTRAVIESYLTERHRDSPATGCLMPALAGEIARESPPVRRAFTGAFQDYAARLAEIIAADAVRHDSPVEDALVLASGMVGAMLLARAVDDAALSERILAAARAFYTGAFSADPATTADAADPGG